MRNAIMAGCDLHDRNLLLMVATGAEGPHRAPEAAEGVQTPPAHPGWAGMFGAFGADKRLSEKHEPPSLAHSMGLLFVVPAPVPAPAGPGLRQQRMA